MREIQASDNLTALLIDGSTSVQSVFSEDNLTNIRTFFEVFMLGDGTKTAVFDGSDPGAAAGDPGRE
jgi:hypothetical protein